MLRKIITFTFLFSLVLQLAAQELKVKSFTHDEMNLEARLDGGRTDLNGKQCALVKVLVRDNIVKCKGGNIGNIITEGVIKKIYVSPSARFLELEFQYSFPIKMTFADYGCTSLSEGSTYTVTLVDAYMMSQQQAQQANQQQSSISSAHNNVSNGTTSSQAVSSTSPPNVSSTTMYGSIVPITVNGVTFNMIKVDGGTFTMGATPEQQNPDSDEKPTHQVTLSSYYIGETEVTQALWKAVMGNNPSKFNGDDLPVENVSWNDCQDFIRKLNGLTGKRFRLPTEAEWKFAARGGNKSRHTQYSGSSNIDEVAWYGGNSGSKTHPVKTKKANELGLCDMTGNVWEWCQDWYGDYDINAQTNPTGPNSGTYRVGRGGCYGFLAGDCRSSSRSNTTPDSRNGILGLRLVLSE